MFINLIQHALTQFIKGITDQAEPKCIPLLDVPSRWLLDILVVCTLSTCYLFNVMNIS